MTAKEYIEEVNSQFKTGAATEHSYRPALQQYLGSLLPGYVVTNEPSHRDCGAPDYMISLDNVPVSFVEAKDINDPDLDGNSSHKEQFNRYKSSLDHIVFTDYLDFHFYEYGEWKRNIRIATVQGNKISICKDSIDSFEAAIRAFSKAGPQSITSANKLAMIMASKAKLLANVIKKTFAVDADNSQLNQQYEAFKNVLIHDLTTDAFADIYAQTIAYGLFAARLHDTTPDTFSRLEAATLIPVTNPFLRKVFQSIAGFDLDSRISWIVDDLAAVFKVCNVKDIMKTYKGDSRHSDPMIHFYEDFLSEYDPALRKAQGVWYTPQPVVRFIVKAVDDILIHKFNFPLGLADYSKTTRKVKNEQYVAKNKRKGEKEYYDEQFHKVQILDPATGTGTFLAEVIGQIYQKFSQNQGMWQDYVANNLIPRINGFEILMASYAIAHLKLDMLLANTGYIHNSRERLNIFLTNSLEESQDSTGSLFDMILSNEANEANRIKRDYPVMVVLGNPPYNINSSNKGKWILNLMKDYKKDLNERKTNLSDDYIKFIRLGQYYIDKNNEGVLAYISNNSFLDGITQRVMRKSLLETFDEIYILNLHGNSKMNELCPDGSLDENVFDIQQGVSINIFIKNKVKSNSLAKVFYKDLHGTRESKYTFLQENNLMDIEMTELHPYNPYYFLVPKDFSDRESYDSGFKISELFDINSMGVCTSRDVLNIRNSREDAETLMRDTIDLRLSDDEYRSQYHIGEDSKAWKVAYARKDIRENAENLAIIPYDYRPFERKYVIYTGKILGLMSWPRFDSMLNMLEANNLCLIAVRVNRDENCKIFVSDHLVDKTFLSSKDNANVFPLYRRVGKFDNVCDLSPDDEMVPNFKADILSSIQERLGENINPLELFDYIYAVLNSPSYREKYKEFIKIDFPRVPYPENQDLYHSISRKGKELRETHLLNNSSNWKVTSTYPIAGSNVIGDFHYSENKVFINETQYFENVSTEVWEFLIGGYAPLSKWLKDHKGHTLSFNDIRHYQEMIHAISESIRIMKEIDVILS